MGQCSHRCPELSHVKTGHRYHEVNPGWSHCWNNRKSRCSQSGVAEADEEIHKQVWKTAVLAKAPKHMWTYMWLTGWPPNRKIQYLRPWSSKSLTRKDRIWNTCWEMRLILRREKLSFESRRSWYSTKESSTLATYQLVNWEKFCDLWSLWFIELPPWMNVTKMLDTRVNRKLCTYCMTGSGGLEWLHRCRRWSATVSNASNMKALIP